MQNNTTLSNLTYFNRVCNFDFEIGLYIYTVTTICSFIENLLVILTVYRNKNLRTSTNYLIVSMSVSDILFPLSILLTNMYINGRFSRQSKLLRSLLCKLLPFISNVSYGVSMLTLVAITVYRFSAVMFPLRAQVQNKRKRFIILVLLLTWVIPLAMNSPWFVYYKLRGPSQFCFPESNKKQFFVWRIAHLSMFHLLPLLIMLIMYPLILIKLKQHRVPGNVINIQAVTKRRRQNFRLTMMFIVLTVAFLLCWGPFKIHWVLDVMKDKVHICMLLNVLFVSFITRVVFHAINPVIYFIFLSSFRQGFKNIFCSSCRIRTRQRSPADNFELNNIPQGLHNN